VTTVEASHAVYISHPKIVARVIEEAAKVDHPGDYATFNSCSQAESVRSVANGRSTRLRGVTKPGYAPANLPPDWATFPQHHNLDRLLEEAPRAKYRRLDTENSLTDATTTSTM
jgi:hypothetical protein